jgi:DNA-binding IclR family transcriptional regulator
MKKPNAWQVFILDVLRAAGGVPVSTADIVTKVKLRGFSHRSENPRATVYARLVELRAAGLVERVDRGTYRAVSVAATDGTVVT